MFGYCYFSVVHLPRDHLITTFELSHILTNTLNNTQFNFLSEISIFNELLIFA